MLGEGLSKEVKKVLSKEGMGADRILTSPAYGCWGCERFRGILDATLALSVLPSKSAVKVGLVLLRARHP